MRRTTSRTSLNLLRFSSSKSKNLLASKNVIYQSSSSFMYFSSTKKFYSIDWSHVQEGPPDPILGITVAYNNDPSPAKVNLGVGAYRDDNGKPQILDCVKRATSRILNDPKENHEYLPIGGEPKFTRAAAKLALGDNSAHIKENRFTTVQTLSGTGALSVAGAFLERFYKGPKKVYLPVPTWANHTPIFRDAGLDVGNYRYYDVPKNKLDFDGLTSDINSAPEGSIILLHACAHNPTGQDPSKEQWQTLLDIITKRKHFPLFDCAYQGFASGDCERDAYAMRLFADKGVNIGICQSFAKNFGLYGERVGSLTFLTSSAKEAKNMESQLKILIRASYSSPPKFGAKLVETILNDEELKQDFFVEVKEMADRIITMRESLVAELAKAGSKKNWDHITSQIGMFCYSGLTPEQVDRLSKEFHIYMTRNGRISMAGVTSKNVAYLAKSMHAVSKDS